MSPVLAQLPILMRSPIWFFDLDNTLHNASHAIFPAVNVNMNRYIAGVLEAKSLPFDADVVNALRYDYWQRYGTTLMGMVRHHQVDPTHFLHEAHALDDLPSMVRTERGLLHMLKRLPGRKILLTNAPQKYARAMLRELGITRQFARHVHVEQMVVHRVLRPKPSRSYLRKLLAHEGVSSRRCVLVEDTLANLKSAKAVGMRTVWLTQFLAASYGVARLPSYVDVKVKSVRRLAASVSRLR